jgi:xylan 1,4-beta-xylosidase
MTTFITIPIHAAGETIRPFWKKLTTAGRAAEGLREDWRSHLREVQREIGFEYIRFHGIFHDDMMIYHEDAQGRPYYNWQYYDSLVDFLREVGLRPIMELSFTPNLLKTNDETVFWWKGSISPPSDYGKWAGMVQAMIRHSIERYGLEEVLQWYFEVWNEANLQHGFWSSDQAEYFKLYHVTAEVIKQVDARLRVGGPATSNFENGEAPWVKDFLAFCQAEHVPVDFLSTHPYPNKWPFDAAAGAHLMGYRGPDSTYEDLTWLRKTVAESAFPHLEIHLTEWNSSPSPRDEIHDTAFMAPFVIYNHLRCLGLVDSLGFWTFTDVFEEGGAGDTIFHGGFGLVNVYGLKKPSYYGYWFLAQLGTECLARGTDYIVTRKNGRIQVLLWNYAFYTPAFQEGDRSGISNLAREVFEDPGPREFEIQLPELAGRCKVLEYRLDREHGSAFDAWLRNGAVPYPDARELAILQQDTGPVGSIGFCEGPGCTRNVSLPPNGVLLLEFIPQ